MEIIIAIFIFGLAILGMSVGVLTSKKCLKRGCDNVKIVMLNSAGESTCGNCGKKL